MDLSFALQALATEYIVKHKKELSDLGSKVVQIPEEIDTNVAYLKCKAMGIELDILTQEQEKYLSSWRVGT